MAHEVRLDSQAPLVLKGDQAFQDRVVHQDLLAHKALSVKLDHKVNKALQDQSAPRDLQAIRDRSDFPPTRWPFARMASRG